MNPDDFRRLVAAGLTNEQIATVMEMMERDRLAYAAADEARKAKARERVQRWRERNVTETQPKVTERLTGGRTHVEDKTSNSETPKESKKEATRASRLPENWTLPDDMRAEAIAMGLPSERCDLEAATMRDWSRSNPNGAKRDWRAAWRNWVRRALPRAGPTANGHAPSLAQVFGMVRERAAENEQRRAGGGGAGAVILDLPAVRAQ